MTTRGVSTALYGWMERFARDGEEWDWRRLYGSCADAGVDAVETDPQPHKLRIVRDLGLTVSSSYIGMPLWGAMSDADLDSAVLPVAERLAAAAGTTLVINADRRPGARSGSKTDDDAHRQGETLSRIADRVRPLGLEISLHNHADDARDAQRDLESVIRWADERVMLCIDTGWSVVAGHDPVAWMRDHGPRVAAVHLRTVDERGVPADDLLSGRPSLDALHAAAPDFAGWLVIELWHPDSMNPESSMIDAVARSADAVRRLWT